MPHVNSYNQRDEDGIFLYDKYNRRIGGPYATEEEATRASKAVSEALGERPVEDYRRFLQETNPGIIGGQSPIPKRRRELTDEEFEAIFNQRAREHRKGLLDEAPDEEMFRKNKDSSFLDWLMPKAGASERVGLMPRERENIFDVDALQEPRDRKLSPVEQLADTEFRVQLNPQSKEYDEEGVFVGDYSVARYSDMYRNPSKYTGVAVSRPGANVSVRAVHIDTPTQLSDTMPRRYGLKPGQLLRRDKSYQISGTMGGTQLPEEVMNHEAFHDAAGSAIKSEFMNKDYQEKYNVLSNSFVAGLGISLAEALAYHHTRTYSKNPEALGQATRWLDKAERTADNLMEDTDPTKYRFTQGGKTTFTLTKKEIGSMYKEILIGRLPQFYAAIEDAAKKRHKALGYK